MTRRAGFVSAWVGRFASEEALLDHVEKAYPGDQPATSPFLTDVPIGPYDEDFAEAGFIGDIHDTAALDEVLDAHSYVDSFGAALRADLRRAGDVNALYLIYDVDASEARDLTAGPMRWLGVYPYERP